MDRAGCSHHTEVEEPQVKDALIDVVLEQFLPRPRLYVGLCKVGHHKADIEMTQRRRIFSARNFFRKR